MASAARGCCHTVVNDCAAVRNPADQSSLPRITIQRMPAIAPMNGSSPAVRSTTSEIARRAARTRRAPKFRPMRGRTISTRPRQVHRKPNERVAARHVSPYGDAMRGPGDRNAGREASPPDGWGRSAGCAYTLATFLLLSPFFAALVAALGFIVGLAITRVHLPVAVLAAALATWGVAK